MATDKKAKDPTPATPPAEPPAPPTPPEPKKEPTGLTFHGDDDTFFGGVPARDLTVRELLDLTPYQVNNITAVGPSGSALYEMTKAGKDAWGAKYDG